MIKDKTGIWGEIHTVRYLREQGYNIVTTNYSTPLGEIDIIASQGKTLAFVEVKTRHGGAMHAPAEYVDSGKQRRIASVATSFMSKHLDGEFDTRFDVAEVYVDDSDVLVSINYIQNAF